MADNGTSAVRIRVLIADDDALIRDGLSVLLGRDDTIEVVACVPDGRAAVDFCRNHGVDVALLDVRMPLLNGLDAAARIEAQGEESRVAPADRAADSGSELSSPRCLILSTFDDDEFVLGALRSGAKGYLLKSSPAEQIRDAIRIIHGGGTLWHESVLEKIRIELSGARREKIPKELFSEREMDIVRLIARGYSNKKIADELFMSEGTVKNYVSAILDKTGLEHRTQIAVYYLTGERGEAE